MATERLFTPVNWIRRSAQDRIGAEKGNDSTHSVRVDLFKSGLVIVERDNTVGEIRRHGLTIAR